MWLFLPLNLLVIVACIILSLLLVIWLLIRFCLVVVTVEHKSMLPTFAPGDRLLAVRHCPVRWLQKGWVVLVYPVPNPASRPTLFGEAPYLKRIVALGGESYQADDQEGQIWAIPLGHVFVRGDHRGHGIDSLVWGALPTRNVLGVVLMPLSHQEQAPATSMPLCQEDAASGREG